jgi:RNA polymerase-binding transcription factor DksA
MATPAETAKQFLTSRCQDLAERLSSVESSRQRFFATAAPDPEERARKRENDPVLDRLAEVTRQELRQVYRALQRIDAGYYGVCERCGKAIGAARLQIVPEATRCSACSAAAQAA